MALRRRVIMFGALGALVPAAACERKPAPRANVTVESVVSPRVDSAAAAVTISWRATDGAFVLLAGDESTEGTEVPPDTLAPIASGIPQGSALRVELFGRGGRVGTATLTPVRPASCGWPRVRLALRDGPADSTRWSVAFAPGVARTVSLDSLERIPRADSSALVADLARLLSALPDDTVPRYRGLPFSVRGAWTFAPAPGGRGVVAEVHRRVAQEANPFEERVLIVAERDSAPPSRWRVTWWARAQGTEETVEAIEALAVAWLGADPWPTLVTGHDAPAGGWVEFVARDSVGAWRSRWRSSPPPACDGRAR